MTTTNKLTEMEGKVSNYDIAKTSGVWASDVSDIAQRTGATESVRGIRNQSLSWEKQTVWDLSNGFQALESHSVTYGPFITQFLKAGKPVWQACNGERDPLPEFARPWLESFSNPAIPALVRCRFEKLFPM